MIRKRRNPVAESYQYLKRRKPVLQNKPISFRPNNEELNKIFNNLITRNKTDIIHEALVLWIQRRDNPSRLMNWLRITFPTKWRYINRKKPYYT